MFVIDNKILYAARKPKFKIKIFKLTSNIFKAFQSFLAFILILIQFELAETNGPTLTNITNLQKSS